MMRLFIALAGFAALVSCETAAPVLPEEPVFEALYAQPDRPLPVIGEIDAIYDGQAVRWDTLDFSLGAIDPSANVTRYDGIVRLFVGGHLPGQDFRENFGRLEIRAELPSGAVPGAGVNVVVAVVDEPGRDGPRYQSGPDARLQITRIVPPDLGVTPYGPIEGTFVATLCRTIGVDGPPDVNDCRPIAGEFSTQGSFEGMR